VSRLVGAHFVARPAPGVTGTVVSRSVVGQVTAELVVFRIPGRWGTDRHVDAVPTETG